MDFNILLGKVFLSLKGELFLSFEVLFNDSALVFSLGHFVFELLVLQLSFLELDYQIVDLLLKLLLLQN